MHLLRNPTPDENHYLNVTWLPVTKDNQYYLNLGPELSLESNPDKEKMDFWDELYSKHFKIWDHQRTDVEAWDHQRTNIETTTTQVIISTEIIENAHESFIQITDKETGVSECVTDDVPIIVDDAPLITDDAPETTDDAPLITDDAPKITDEAPLIPTEAPKITDDAPEITNDAPKITNDTPKTTNDVQKLVNNYQKEIEVPHLNGNGVDKPKPRTSNEIKMVSSNGAPIDVIRANDPPEDDLPKNIGVNKFVNFFESLGGKK